MLLLFDIDGTLLLKATREHREALHEAIRRVWSVEIPGARVETAGRTDPAIARQILALAEVRDKDIDDGMPAFREAASEAYARLVPRTLAETVAPGVPELLERLSSSEGCVLSLVTGNLEPIARLKLARAGLGRFFAPGQGGFGSDHEDRAALPAVARKRAGRPHAHYPRERTVVIGDTPLDVQCAQAEGVACIAVTTGPYGEADLAGADAVVHRASEIPDALVNLFARA